MILTHEVAGHKTREKAQPGNINEVGAPMAGVVVEIRVKPGADVKVGDPLAVLSAMKMETIVSSPASGRVEGVSVQVNDSLNAGDLICRLSATEKQ